jgi:hypothetical protein
MLLDEGIALFPSGFSWRDFIPLGDRTYAKGLIALTYLRSRRRTKGKL